MCTSLPAHALYALSWYILWYRGNLTFVPDKYYILDQQRLYFVETVFRTTCLCRGGEANWSEGKQCACTTDILCPFQKILCHHHHHHHVPEGLGVFSVPWSSKWSWSKVDMLSGVIQTLICKTHKSWENQTQQQRRLCRQILLPRPRRLRQCSWNCSRQDRVQAKVQRLKTGPIQLREHIPTEKHTGLEASRWQTHH